MVLVKDGVSESETICDEGEGKGRTKHYFKVGYAIYIGTCLKTFSHKTNCGTNLFDRINDPSHLK